MHVLVILPPSGRQMVISKRAKSLKQYIVTAKNQGWAWRYHDGAGWADGSLEAYKVIDTIMEPCRASIVY